MNSPAIFVIAMVAIVFTILVMFMDIEVRVHPSIDHILHNEERIEAVALRLDPPVLCMIALVGILMMVCVW